MWRRIVCVALFLGGFGVSVGSAHDDPNADVPSIRALRVDAPLTVDGILDEPFWSDADVGSGFIEKRSQKPVVDQTLVRVAYSRTHLYVAMECMDESIEEVQAIERREDRTLRGDDYVEVHLDPFHDHRSEYIFAANLLGTRRDSKSGAGGGSNVGWTADWQVAVNILEDRWVVEMQVPFSALNYFLRNTQTWGINFYRDIPRTESLTAWSFNRTNFYSPRYFGHLTDLDLADTRFDRNWEFEPYVSSRYDFGNGEEDTIAETGIDFGVRLTPSITTAWTLNPDFGEVEADPDTIELRDTERFLAEQRPFFREGEELFGMPHMLYHSRRFTDINVAGKTTGKVGDYNFNFLEVLGDVSRGTTRHGNTSVLRTVQEVGEKSSIGYYVGDSEFDDGHSRVGSVDSNLFLSDDLIFGFQGSVADDVLESRSATTAKDSTDFLGFTDLTYQSYPWLLDVNYVAITDEFDPALGYIPRNNIFGPSAMAQYAVEQDTGWYKSHSTTLQAKLLERENGDTFIRDFQASTEFEFHNDIAFQVSHEEEYRAPYNNWKTRSAFFIFTSDYWRVTDFFWTRGEFEEINFDEFILSRRIKLLNRIPIRYTFTVRWEDDIPRGKESTVWLNQIIFDYYFTEDMFVKNSIQNQDGSKHNISVIYGWEFVKNATWYLVYNSVNKGYDTEQSIFTKVAYRL
ncbi:MAG: DUF5916 domain-containing protein [bacterium]